MKASHSKYLDCLLDSPDSFNHRLSIAYRLITERNLQFDAIAFRGMSGALFAPTLSLRLEKQLIMVRKDTEDSHSSCLIEGVCVSCRYIVVDDFMASGHTCREIQREIYAKHPESTCVGIYFYRDEYWASEVSLARWKRPTPSRHESARTMPAPEMPLTADATVPKRKQLMYRPLPGDAITYPFKDVKF